MFDDVYEPARDRTVEGRRHASTLLMFAGLAVGDAHADSSRRISEITQTSLAVTEGALRGYVRFRNGKQPVLESQLLLAMLRWAVGQELELRPETASHARVTGWLGRQAPMLIRRPQGNTTRAALVSAGVDQYVASNTSKGSACVPRAAGCSLLYPDVQALQGTWEAGAHSAALTHGHPVAHAAAGVFATTLRLVREGADPVGGAFRALEIASDQNAVTDEHAVAEVAAHLQKAADRSAGGGTYESVEQFGGWHGRTAEQALAIAVWAVQRGGDLGDVLKRATDHGGERRSTGAAAGALWGALTGRHHADRAENSIAFDAPAPHPLDELPDDLRPRSDELALVEAVAEDAARLLRAGSAIEYADRVRWPGW